jgi:hypothetical protein
MMIRRLVDHFGSFLTINVDQISKKVIKITSCLKSGGKICTNQVISRILYRDINLWQLYRLSFTVDRSSDKNHNFFKSILNFSAIYTMFLKT